ncbi:MAG: hypothetical protein ABFD64_02820 [Armatimonadota bacterium]
MARQSNTSKRKQALDILAEPFDTRMIRDVFRAESKRKGKGQVEKAIRVIR